MSVWPAAERAVPEWTSDASIALVLWLGKPVHGPGSDVLLLAKLSNALIRLVRLLL